MQYPGHKLIEGIENPYMPQRYRIKLLERLALSPIIQERLKAAAHSDTPYRTLEQLAGDLELPIRIAVKYHANSPTQLIEQIEAQHEIAQNWETNPEELTVLSNSPWSWIRLAVARNPYTPPETLAKLAQDSEEKIQFAVVYNLATPKEVLDLLVNNYYQEITEIISKHPNASEQALIELLPKHHEYICMRPDLPASVLAELIKYNSGRENRYKEELVNNPNTPGETLTQLVDFPVPVAKHPNVLASTLEQLAQHSSAKVRLAVFQNPKTPDLIKSKLLEDFLQTEDYEIFLELAICTETQENLLLHHLV